MYRVLTCLTTEHSLWLVGLAAIVCVGTALTAFRLYAIALASGDLRKLGWAALTGVCAGAGIWATHFVAMLAYKGGFPTSYDPGTTLLSLLIAMTVAAIGFSLASYGWRWGVIAGGVIIGSAIGSMHYVGMDALELPGTISWDLPLVGISLLIGLSIAPMAMVAVHRARGGSGLWLAAGLLALAICGLHFTAMGAVTVVPDPTIPFQASGFNRTLMAFAVAGVTSVVLLSAHALAAIQRSNLHWETALRDQNDRFAAAMRYLPVGLSMFDSAQRLTMCNTAYRAIYHLGESITRPGTSFTEIMLSHAKETGSAEDPKQQQELRDWMAGYFAKLACGKQFTDMQQLEDGRSVFVRIGPIPGGGWVDIQEDITERRQTEAKIAHMAHHDALTDLPNRVLLCERLQQVLDSERRGEHAAILCLDLDRFKAVNDTLGHPIGDALLKLVAGRLLDTVRDIDTVARVSGDEFIVLQASKEPSKDAAALAARIIEALSAPFDVNGQQVVIGTSVGIAVSPHDGTDPEALLKHADLALYRSKKEGRGTYSFFEPEMNRLAQARRELERDLRSALANGELELQYQPLISLSSNEINGCEALLRWSHPQRGLILPMDFIPIAEETGLIIPIGEWVLREACAEAATWPDHIKIAVNLSPVQFKNRRLVETVFNAIAAAGLAPNRLELEITESVLLHDSDATLAILRELHELGVCIAMDDFGTGYSSLSYLRTFPFDKIKIDRCFIASLSEGDENALAIVRAIGGLGRALNMSVTAEGVETEDQLDIVRVEGCDEMQGYFFSAPKSANELRRYFPPAPEQPVSSVTTAVA